MNLPPPLRTVLEALAFEDEFGGMTRTSANLVATGTLPVLRAGQGFSNIALQLSPAGGSNGGGVVMIHGDLHVDGTSGATVQTNPTTFSQLAACTSATEGTIRAVTDSTTNT